MIYYKKINCPICSNENFKVLIKGQYEKYSKDQIKSIFSSSSNNFIDQVVECKNCKFIYLNPRLDSEIIISGYEEVEDTTFVSQDKFRIKTFESSLEKLNRNINLKDKKILDVGSANGAFLYACKNKGFNATGIEPSKWLVELGKNEYNVNLVNGSFEKFEFNEKYDVIFFWDVLEHVFDLDLTRTKIDEILNKNGYLVINCPDHDSLMRKILRTKWPFYLSVHLYYFNLKSLMNIFSKQFIFEKKLIHFQYLSFGYVLSRAKKYFKFFSFVEKLVKILGINNFSIKYNMGQTTFVFKKK